MSAWPIPDEVVRAFARQTWPAYSDRAPEDYPEAWVACLANARDFLERHRLVVLPEEPMEIEDEWAVEWEYANRPRRWYAWGDRATCEKEARFYRDADLDAGRTTGRIMRLLPGQPTTVDKEESDGDE